MKIEMVETFKFSPQLIFTVLIDIQHHTNWAEGLIELISLTDNPAKLGTKWEHVSDLLGRRLITLNECNVYETNHKFGWVAKKPITSHIILGLQSGKDSTTISWGVESEATGIAQLAEPLLVKETKDRIRKSFDGLNIFLQAQV